MNNGSANMTSPPECFSGTEPPAVRWFKNVAYLMLLALALFGNALVMWIIYKYKRMHTPSNCLIFNLAVSTCVYKPF